MVEYLEVGPWGRSNVDTHLHEGLITSGQLTANTDSSRPAWIVLSARHQELQPPVGYVVSLVRLHERGFNAPAGWFMWGLCYHYGMELHNFSPNAMSQAATFVGICEGFLGVPVSWDLWLHLFRAELFTLAAGGKGRRRPVRTGGLVIAL
jgi:hypothetical protein